MNSTRIDSCIFICSIILSLGSLVSQGWTQTSSLRIATGIANPTFITHAPGDADRLFVLEQGSGSTARIRLVSLGTGDVSTFLTITGMRTGFERGLLGMAFHPDYANNGYFYVYTSVPGSPDHNSLLRRYQANGDPLTALTADAGSSLPLLRFSQPFGNHNGGWIGFNPNISGSDPQYLYVSTGDGGSGGDPGNNAQDTTNNLLGKMLRIDVDGDDFPADPNRNYAIPSTNPFVGVTGDDEIWAYGLRNPWRNSFDRENGDMWVADVGQNAREEINYQPADSTGGQNYGWRVKEANACYDNSQAGGNPPCSSDEFTPPVYSYAHGSGSFNGNSVTGGYVYRGPIAQYEGLYFFADFDRSHVWTIDPHAVNIQTSVVRRNGELLPNAGSFRSFTTFGEDDTGNLYAANYFTGDIFKFVSSAELAQWNGDDPLAGTSGNGTSWTDANNWTRGGSVDTAFVTRDEVLFGSGSSVTTIDLEGTQTAGGVRFAADYTLQGGTLRVLGGNVRVAAGVTATIDADLEAENANMSIRKRDAGTLLVNGTAHQTVVLDGTLAGTGSVDWLTVREGGTINPGDNGVGTLRVSNGYVQHSDASLQIEIASAGPTVMSDVLDVTANAKLAGQLEILAGLAYQDPTIPGSSDVFQVLLAGSVEGQFGSVIYDGVELEATFGPEADGSFRSHQGDGLFRNISYNETSVALSNYQALPGDANGDGNVDASDFNIWNGNKFETGTGWLTGDFDNNGTTDISDFNIWNANKFTSVNSASVVPEPGMAAVFCCCLCFLIRRSGRLGRPAARTREM